MVSSIRKSFSLLNLIGVERFIELGWRKLKFEFFFVALAQHALVADVSVAASTSWQLVYH
jgi:hypothetical protein